VCQPKYVASTPDGDEQEYSRLIEKLHPSLRDYFLALPPKGNALTNEQLFAVFGGDHRALGEIAKLVCQSDEMKQNRRSDC
jgi:hypothetical protein